MIAVQEGTIVGSSSQVKREGRRRGDRYDRLNIDALARKACFGKLPFTKTKARSFAAAWDKYHADDRLTYYKCHYCHRWHTTKRGT